MMLTFSLTTIVPLAKPRDLPPRLRSTFTVFIYDTKLLFIKFAKVIHFIVMVSYFSPFRINPFAHIRLRKTVTNDRSAPIIEWGSYRRSRNCVPCGVSFHLNIRLKTGNSLLDHADYTAVLFTFSVFVFNQMHLQEKICNKVKRTLTNI